VTTHACLLGERARGSGIEFDSRFGFVLWVEHGLIVCERDFSDLDEALRVAGIPVAAGNARIRLRGS
jgi:hypothetical protein